MSSTNIISRDRNIIINPLKTCQPLGAMYAVMGVKHGFPLVHGSQGCSTFVRYNFCRHFREPAEIAVSSLHEDAAVFGGRKNINAGIKNIATRFRPELIGTITTCSSEIIGDDVYGFVDMTKRDLAKMSEEEEKYKGLDEIEVVPIPTPSFVGNHFTGYDVGIKSLVLDLAKTTGESNEKINIIPGLLNPGDTKEIKHILRLLGVGYTMLTDPSEAFDSPLRPSKETTPYFAKGGVTVDEIKDSGNSLATIPLCKYAKSGAEFLERDCGVPSIIDDIPIGIKGTDQFLRNVMAVSDCDVSEELLDERGRAIDMMADLAGRYLFDRPVAIVGDPSMTVGLARFVGELGMKPTMVCTGADEKTFPEDMEKVAKETNCDIDVLFEQDMRTFEVYVKEHDIDLMIGNSEARILSTDTNIPLIRAGYPVYDRVGYHTHPVVGYNGAKRLTELITNAIIERYYEETHWKLQQ